MTPVSIVLRDSGVFTIRPIQSERELEVDAVVAMVNRCYRSTENWTNENAILEGVRICRDSLKYNAKQFDIFVVEDPESKAIVGCIKTGLTQDTVVAKLPESVGCIGLFAVSPDFQSRGLGSRIMRFAENFCREKGARRMALEVLSVRNDIIAWYERCGYTNTGMSVDSAPFFKDKGEHMLQPASFVLFIKLLV
ncbi:Streptothricin acetyltransferase [Gracilariopsis chorda]|uniref:Streptothricin acetyltransferase n=1 Tax=Gracilariopsis chorda TaxID=448386 RepID=A0A2V3IYP0_9FLOR|nr:Streptothricin acetyltransferase [Gracilariopsis chorda]|eukprot:PXF47185.1 Streptothricin acetyltransferase [Gracilariopsis chorda]